METKRGDATRRWIGWSRPCLSRVNRFKVDWPSPWSQPNTAARMIPASINGQQGSLAPFQSLGMPWNALEFGCWFWWLYWLYDNRSDHESYTGCCWILNWNIFCVVFLPWEATAFAWKELVPDLLVDRAAIPRFPHSPLTSTRSSLKVKRQEEEKGYEKVITSAQKDNNI